MGAKLSRCDAPPAPPPLPSTNSPPPPPPDADEKGEAAAEKNDSISEAISSVSAYSNPGPWEAFNSECKRVVFLDTFDGAKVDLSKQLSPFLLINHNWMLGTTAVPDPMKNFYSFTTQVMVDEQTAVIGRIDAGGTVEARVHRGWLQSEDLQVATKVVAVATPEFNENNQMVMDVDVGGRTWSGQVKMGSLHGGNILGLSYVQSITPSLTIGGDALHLGSQGASIGSYGVRYAGTDWIGCGQWSGLQQAMMINYKRTVTPNRVTLGAELQIAPTFDTAVSFGGEFNLKQSKFSTVVDGGGGIKSVLEARLGPAATLVFSGEVDHGKDVYKFGYGLTIGG
mmetsp:Transcript_9086/g.18171  ORF Transcript_9086/g.18171 Transcript_9086/m.18171 type:complete len:339 (+) Transcript_9086:138-1154(+)|eukprot:CAMPEP_0182454250 /NCGR_PEP_ID=MMETSP1319-20130603/965_1 /TAXON_ID=172717 /ORGANISM="Bolidomonas pacifica, Strain RCC208" /LENGTH=338 /DNA_ID=CAMNT_0024652251 /DNA_START=117 /DNA_END=1133 /DNA_ORIENTATION=+